MKKLITKVMALIAILSVVSAYGGLVQVGDFRIGSVDYGVNTYFDPGFTNTTRGVTGAPVNISSTFTGTSQNAGGTSPDSATDIGLRTYTSVTSILNMNRYASPTDGNAGGRIGIVQWNFDLTPLDSYLSDNALSLTALDLDLVLDLPGDDGYDVYLSYTDADAGTTLTDISASDPTSNYHTFWWAAENDNATAGDIVDGKFEVLVRDQVDDGAISDSLLTLYGNGVREFNLTLMTPDYNNSQQTKVQEDSGLSITTEEVPEPVTIGMLEIGALLMLVVRRFKRRA